MGLKGDKVGYSKLRCNENSVVNEELVNKALVHRYKQKNTLQETWLLRVNFEYNEQIIRRFTKKTCLYPLFSKGGKKVHLHRL